MDYITSNKTVNINYQKCIVLSTMHLRVTTISTVNQSNNKHLLYFIFSVYYSCVLDLELNLL